MPVSEYPSRRALRAAAIKKKRGRNATVVTAGGAVAVPSAAGPFGANAASDGQLFALGQTAEAEAPEPALKTTPRQTSVIPAPITGGDERVVAKMTDEMAASQVGLGRLYQEGEGDVAAGQLAVAEAQNPDNGSLKKLPGNIQMIYPADSTRTSSTFGMRGNPTGAGSQFHVGTDFPVPSGTPVKASVAGTVIFAGVHSSGGYRCDSDHGNGVVSACCHYSQLIMGDSMKVSQGNTFAQDGY